MVAGFEDKALIGTNGFVALVALDLHVADGNMLPRRGRGRRGLRQSRRGETDEGHESAESRVGKGGREATINAPRLVRLCPRGPTGLPGQRGQSRIARKPAGMAPRYTRCAFAHPTEREESNHRSPRPTECARPESKPWPCES